MIDPLDKALAYSKSGFPEKSEEILRSLSQDDNRVLFNLGWHDIRHGDLLKGMEGLNAGRHIEVFGSPPIASPAGGATTGQNLGSPHGGRSGR